LITVIGPWSLESGDGPLNSSTPENNLTGFNETEAESASHWMDDRKNYVKRATVQGFFDQILGQEQNRMDPQLMADAMVAIIPRETGHFRNVVPQLAEDMVKAVQQDVWESRIDLPSPETVTAA